MLHLTFMVSQFCLNTCFSTRFLFASFVTAHARRKEEETELREISRWTKKKPNARLCKRFRFASSSSSPRLEQYGSKLKFTASPISDEACIQIAHFAISRQQNELLKDRRGGKEN